MYFITTKRMLEVCFFQHTPTFIIEPYFFIFASYLRQILQKIHYMIIKELRDFYAEVANNMS